jgi:ABC-2 type transport system permease protein
VPEGDPPVIAVARRELERISRDRISLWLLLLLPLGAIALLWATFSAEVVRDLPVAVFDGDHSALSRRLIRMLDATPSVRVAEAVPSPEAGYGEILSGRAWAVVVIPRGLEKAVLRGEASPVICYLNAQALIPAGAIRRDVTATVATLSAGVQARARLARGASPGAALAAIRPIRVEAHTLFNPGLSYVTYMTSALLPTVLQIFVLLAAVQALGSELRDGTGEAWLRSSGGSIWKAVAGKLAVYTAYFVFLTLALLALFFRAGGVPFAGSGAVIVAGTLLFVLAYQALAVLFVAAAGDLRLATSAASFFSGPAFAFAGVTFPAAGMTPVAKVWSALLPLTHYLGLVVDQAIRGAGPAASAGKLAALAAFVVLAPAASLWRYRRLMTSARSEGES